MSREQLKNIVSRMYGEDCDPKQTRVSISKEERAANKLEKETFGKIVDSLRGKPN